MLSEMEYLKKAGEYARQTSGCLKVSVGCVIVSASGRVLSWGSNRTDLNLCKQEGCLRFKKYGDNTKSHRNPDDCRAIHSEIDAISKAAREGIALKGSTIYVTRYPCEACTRAIVAAGIKKIVYGREQTISNMTSELLHKNKVGVNNVSDYQEDDNNT